MEFKRAEDKTVEISSLHLNLWLCEDKVRVWLFMGLQLKAPASPWPSEYLLHGDRHLVWSKGVNL